MIELILKYHFKKQKKRVTILNLAKRVGERFPLPHISFSKTVGYTRFLFCMFIQ